MGAYKPIEERLAAKTDRTGECWVWLGAVATSGYGRIGRPRHGTMQAHRAAYEVANGPIPDGLHIDHLCKNRLCVRPEHLEAVTQAENNRRAGSVRRANQTHCKYGHKFSPDNTFFHTRDGSRQCRTCHSWAGRASRRGMTLETFARLLEGGVLSGPVVVQDTHTIGVEE